MSTSMEEQLEAELRKLERKMIHIHGEQFEPDSRPRCDVSRSSTFADVAVTERKRRDGERREVKNKQNMYRDQLIKTYRPLLEEELRKIDGNLPQVGTPAHKKLLTKIRTQIFVRVRSPTLPPPPSLCRVRACVRACVRARARARPPLSAAPLLVRRAQRVDLEVQRWALEGGTSGAELPSESVSTIANLVDAASVHKEAAEQFESNFTTGTKFW